MTAAKQLTPPLVKLINTGVDFDSRMPNRLRQAWQRIIDEKLFLWLQHPEQLEDDDQIAPTGTVVRIAMDIAERVRDAGMPPPGSVTVDSNGGIVFERRDGEEAEVIHVWDDQTVDFLKFRGSQLIFRSPLSY